MGTIGIDENNNGMVNGGYGQNNNGYAQNGGYGQYNYNNGYAQGGASDFGRKAGTVGKDAAEKGKNLIAKVISWVKGHKKVSVIIGAAMLAAILLLVLLKGAGSSASGGASSAKEAAKEYIKARMESPDGDRLLSIMLPSKAKSSYNKMIKSSRGISAAEYTMKQLDMGGSYSIQDLKVKSSDSISKENLSDVEDEILDRFGVEVKVQAAEKVTLTFKRKKGEDGKWKDYKANFYCYKADGRWYALIRDSER